MTKIDGLQVPSGPVRIRYRRGVVGESLRVVHTAVALPSGGFRTLCQVTLDAEAAELVEGGGMPCMQCVARLALRSRAEGVSSSGLLLEKSGTDRDGAV